MTRVVEIHSVDEIDHDLVSLIEIAKEHSQEGQTKLYFGVTLRDLVRTGVLPAGTSVVLVGRGTDLTRAEVGAAGEILWRGGSYRSLSDRVFGPLLGPGREHFNGWTHWHAELPSGRVVLAALRAAYLADQPSTDRRLDDAG